MAGDLIKGVLAVSAILAGLKGCNMAIENQDFMCAVRPDGYTCNKLREENGYSTNNMARDLEILIERDKTGAGKLVQAFYNNALDESHAHYNTAQQCYDRTEEYYDKMDTSRMNSLYSAKKQRTFLCLTQALKP